MMRVIIQREASADHGTFGRLTTEIGWGCNTLELPWRDNRKQQSSIPAGVYRCAVVQSAKFGKVYGVANVPTRSGILIHAGNYGGDTKKGLRSDIEGCILLGLSRGMLNHQQVVMQSKQAVADFQAVMGGQPFELEVRDA
jgi:hypothetical protein